MTPNRPHATPTILSRRAFATAGLGLVGTLLARRRVEGQTTTTSIHVVNGERVNRILADLQTFGGTGNGGTTRLAYSDEDLAAREFVRGILEEAGLTVDADLAGNLVGRRPGRFPDRAPLIIGSHIDSVPEGGSYDGQVGSAGALEVALTLHEQGIELDHPLEVMIFQNEEGGKTGSRALVGRVEPFELEIETASGFTIAEGIRRLGGAPERLAEARREAGSIHGFLELHIEQGAVLEASRRQIGVVEGIVGIRRWNVDVRGSANHAGTTPMDQRKDALVAASELIVAIHEIASSGPGRQVATVGRIAVQPDAPNVVPGSARFTLEIRDLSMERIDEVFQEVQEAAAVTDGKRSTRTGFERFYESLGAPTDPRLRQVVEDSAHAAGFSTLRMPSGAGHDAQSMAELGPVGMVFVPSRSGISHSPDEWTHPDDIARGTEVLFHTLVALDQLELPWPT